MLKKITAKRQKNGVITHLKVDGVEKTRQEVYDDLEKNDYWTYPNGVKGSKVHKIGKFITTKPNDTTRDNLDELPNFN